MNGTSASAAAAVRPVPWYDLTEPMAAWSASRRTARFLVALLLAFVVTVAASQVYVPFADNIDATAYLDMAAGKQVAMPFASRQLAPLIVHGLYVQAHLPILNGYIVLGVIELLVTLGVVIWLVVQSGSPRWMLPAVAGLFFWVMQFDGLILPDLGYAALMACLLLLLRNGHGLAAALMMFPLMLDRESTLLTLLCLLAAGWRRLRWYEALTALGATLAGILVVKRLTVHALPNQEHISPVLYLFAKMPWNGLRNLLGVTPYANGVPSCAIPRWSMPVHLGPVHVLGLCGVSLPVWTIMDAFSVFALLPFMLWRLRRVRVPAAGRGDMLLRFCLVYGGISFLMAPLLGTTTGRLFSYSWPIFLVALPMLVAAGGANFGGWRAALAFLAVHLSLSWLHVMRLPLWQIATVLFVGGSWLIAKTFRVSPNGSVGPAAAGPPALAGTL